MKRVVCRLPVLALIAAVGCVQFQAKPLAPDRTADAFEARTLADPGLQSFLASALDVKDAAQPDRPWTVDELTAVALYFHSEFELARRHADTVRAGVQTAGEIPNPTLSVSPGYNTSSSRISPWIVGLGLDFTMETAGKRRHRTAEAQHRAEAAGLAVASAAWKTREVVREAALALARAREERQVEAESAEALASLAVLMERQNKAGEVSTFDLAAVRMTADRAKMAVAEAAGKEAVARVRLAAALGLPTPAVKTLELRMDSDSASSVAPDAQRARRAAMTGRADLLAALAGYSAAQAALQLAIAGQYPDLQLGPGYEFDQDDNKWSLGLALTLPVFNRNRGAIAEAMARREEAAAAVRALQERIAAEVDAALADCLAAADRRKSADALLDTAVHRLAAVEAMRTAGELASADVLTARAEAARSRIEALNVRWEHRSALGRLEDALQRPADLPESLWKTASTAVP